MRFGTSSFNHPFYLEGINPPPAYPGHVRPPPPYTANQAPPPYSGRDDAPPAPPPYQQISNGGLPRMSQSLIPSSNNMNPSVEARELASHADQVGKVHRSGSVNRRHNGASARLGLELPLTA
jgi:hypothetical protein